MQTFGDNQNVFVFYLLSSSRLDVQRYFCEPTGVYQSIWNDKMFVRGETMTILLLSAQWHLQCVEILDFNVCVTSSKHFITLDREQTSVE